MKISNYVIAALVFTIFIVGSIAMINYFIAEDVTYAEDSQGTYTDFQTAFNRTNELINRTDALEARLLQDGDLSRWDQISIIFSKGFSVVSSVTTSFSLVGDMLDETSNIFGFLIPNWFTLLVGGILTVAVLFAILSIFLQRPDL